MYSSRDGTYAQKNYAAQSSYGQTTTSAYPGNSSAGADAGSQLTVASLHPSMLAGSHERDIGAYRALPTTATHYTGQYSSLYNPSSLSSGQQASTLSTNSVAPSALEARLAARHELSKFGASDYMSPSGLGYGLKTDRLAPGQYGERQNTYAGRDLQPEPAARFPDSVGYAHAHQHQSEIYDRIDQAVLREQMLKSQSLQSASHDCVARHPDYIAARSATSRHPTQELDSYGVRVESSPHAMSIGSRPSYGGQPSPSVLGAAPQRTAEGIMHTQVSLNPGYGVSLPPGRDYGAGKGLHRSSLEADDLQDERGGCVRDLDSREEDRRRERLREREKEREREREREREKDRKREREKDRERKHILELRERERERDRERKRALDARRERSPPRVSRDRHSSLTKDSRSIHRDSPRQGALLRLHSPVKDKRREYVCKVYSSRLVDVERDYMSMDKRYPRLYISPEFSKLVVRWPKESLNLPFRTPVSFEHDFVEEETGAGQKKTSAELMEQKSVDSVNKGTVWNAKIILMSGLGRSLMEELSSDRISGDRIPHICNLLRFAVLKRGRSFMAIGGQWDPIDGGNPSNDDDSLVRTALRYAKDVAQLDLQNCKHWNRFLEIHYDRVGKDGLFSHTEITVLFVPDLSHCLPSLNVWREQWLAHKKAVDEREKLLTSKKEKAREKKESKKEEINSAKETKRSETSDRKKEAVGTNLVPDTIKQKEVDGLSVVGVGDQGKESSRKAPVKKDGSELADEGKDITKKDVDIITPQDSAKPGKKKIVRRIVKKVARKKAGPPSESKVNAIGSEKVPEDKDVEPERTADPADVKTFTRRKVTKTGSVGTAGASILKEDKTVESSVKVKDVESSVKVEAKQVPSAAKSLDKSDPSKVASTVGGPAKKTVKRKIIKRVLKKKNTIGDSTNDTKELKDCDNDEHGKIQDSGNAMAVSKVEAQVDNGEKIADGIKSGNDLISSSQPGKAECKADKVVQKEDDKSVSGAKLAVEADKRSPMKNPETNANESMDKENLSDGKGKKDKAGKDEPKARSSKDAEKKSEEPPRPGFILQTRCGKDARLRSMSLSLDSLLDYSDKDVEESNFELSLFAESLYEMLQYQMGSRILTFLQKLRIKFVTERNQRKRHREETAGKQMDEQKSSKRLKTEQLNGETSSKSEATVKSEVKDEAHPDEERTEVKEKRMVIDENNKVKMEAKDVEGQLAEEDEEYEEEEDPEEAPQEDEEMKDASPEADSSNKQNNGERITHTATEPEELGKDAKDSSAELKSLEKVAKEMDLQDANKATERKDAGAATKPAQNSTVDRELVQAFRFFDRNRTGYIRLEDMRLILHNLGKCLSHRDVKELAQSALLESNTGRDDRILYEKLVKMSFSDEQ